MRAVSHRRAAPLVAPSQEKTIAVENATRTGRALHEVVALTWHDGEALVHAW